MRSRYGDDHPRTLRSINDLGVMYQAARRPEVAEPLLLEALTRADLTVVADDGSSARTVAERGGHAEVVQLLGDENR